MLWLVWYAKYHQSLGAVGTVRDVTSFAFHEFYFTFAAFVGGEQIGGVVLAAVLLVGVVVAVRQHVAHAARLDRPSATRSPRAGVVDRLRGWAPDLREATVTPRVAGAVAAAVGFAFATAVSRQVLLGQVQSPDVARYLWVIGIFLAVALADCCKAVRLGPIVAVVAVAGLIFNGVVMVHGLDAQRQSRLVYQHEIVPLIAATQALGARSPDRILPIVIVVIHAHEYVTAVARDGAPPGSTGQPVGFEKYKLIADSWMTIEVSVEEVSGADGPPKCRPISAGQAAAVVPGSTIVVQTGASPVGVRLRRYAARSNPPVATLAPRTDQLVVVPRDGSSVPWRVRLSAPATASVCRS